jgi:hypothetical protein
LFRAIFLNIILTPLFIMPVSALGQSTYNPEIVPLNGTELCSGFSLENAAQVKMTTPTPSFAQRKDVYAVYTWVAEHPNGIKRWNTSSNQRMIPLPWEGTYIIKVKVDFIHISFPIPFAGEWSNSIKISARPCMDPKSVLKPRG